MTEFLIIIGLILINGLFSMAEIALISARKARLETQANKGDKKAEEALRLANHPDTFLSTVQIGITLMAILTGIFSGETLEKQFTSYFEQYPTLTAYAGIISRTTVVIIITYLSLVLGELVPKRIGLSYPETIAKIAAAPMHLLSRAAFPFVWLLGKSTHLMVRILNIQDNKSAVTEEEIKAIINEGTEHGAIEEAEQEIIERVFHLGDRNITSLMTHRSDMVWVDITATVADVKKLVAEDPHSVYPVCNNQIDNIKGIISIKDLFGVEDQLAVQSIMKPATYVPENNSAYQVLSKFKESRVHHSFIVDEYGSLLGFITLNDILDAIVGDIAEDDDDEYEIVTREDGSILVDAQYSFYDFLSYIDKTDWIEADEEQEFDTLAGFILHQLERIPKTGDILEWRGYKFEIIDMDNHRIDKILISSDTLNSAT